MLNLNSIANYVICNNLTLDITDIEYGIEDKVIWKWSNENNLHKSKIYTSRKGDYFLVNKMRYYINEFCRVCR